MKHFISLDQLSVGEIMSLLESAEQHRKNERKIDTPLFAANLFFEPSTRTSMSFIVSQKKLGMEVIDFHADTSSIKKGESLYDTAKTFEAIGANLLVIRHHDDNWIEGLADKMAIPVINAGAGTKEHPTQCLLDLLTIYQEFGDFSNLNIAIVGDIKHSRVAHSNAQALQRLGANVFISAAPGFEDPCLEIPALTIDEAVERCDVIMLLRVQHERHANKKELQNYLAHYGMTKARERKMKPNAIIMHPAPVNRGVEIDESLVECNRSRIFKQMENGVYARMAVITHLLEGWGITNAHAAKERQAFIAG
ncbi:MULTISPECIES: aspartate carbamoyltransferase catalytic subunit [unclassified Virgibacillus]|uniref:aspartate carbamoyltransferase catalytic subunit n=1 Tax=unclassified Virgibacillus TaxID=2620237 RepID=UPI0024DEFC0F|nr:aspartate carbamoyltransferase catalytic subunit [Virgibacillus sp. LDC-1]